MKRYVSCTVMLFCALLGWAGGAEEREASTARAKYLADRGTIIPYHEVRIDTFISAVDYKYPDPVGEFGINVHTGHKQVSTKGQDEIVLIGLQGKRHAFQDLPPMNFVLVVDKSGSMGEPDKIDWAKESLAIFLKNIRDKDYVSLVVFDEQARVLIPSVQMNIPRIREQFQQQIQSITPGGDSNITAGIKLGFQEVMSHFSFEYTNRVMLLTDGWGNAKGIIRMVKEYRGQGVEVSVIGYGANFDIQFAEQLVHIGGGSSRFISDQGRMEEVFGSGLSRTTVPLARNITLKVSLKEGKLSSTWGYDHIINSDRNAVQYYIPTIHSSDYETILLQINLPETQTVGSRPVIRVETSYTDLRGISRQLEPTEVKLDFVQMSNPVTGFSDARALKAGSMLHYADALREISGDYYYSPSVYNAFFRAFDMKKELENAKVRLSDDSFDEEIDVLEKYMRILGREIGLKETIVEQIIADNEVAPVEKDRTLMDHLDNLFRELLLRLEETAPGNIAVSGFSIYGRETSALVDFINEAGAARLTKFGSSAYTIVERNKLNEILREQELALSDLVEPYQAIQVGKILAANYLVTGRVIPASESVVIFGRIINVETAVIESVAQVIVPRNEEVDSLL